MTATQILRKLFEDFPQFNPQHKEYDTGVNGGDLVDWVSEMTPEIIEALSKTEVKMITAQELIEKYPVGEVLPDNIDTTERVWQVDVTRTTRDTRTFTVTACEQWAAEEAALEKAKYGFNWEEEDAEYSIETCTAATDNH